MKSIQLFYYGYKKFLKIEGDHLKQATGNHYSARRISIELDTVQQSILYDMNNRDNKYVIPSKSSKEVFEIYDTMKLHRNVVPYKIPE